MIVSARPLPPVSRWRRLAALLCVLVVLPLGIAQAGEGESKRDKIKPTPEEMQMVERKIREAVASGALTAEEGRAKWEAYLEGCGIDPRKHKHGDELKEVDGRKLHKHKKLEMDAMRKRIEEAVERGEITREEANAKYEAIHAELEQRKRWLRIKEEIEAAVKNGSLTREEADAKYKELHERWTADRKRAQDLHKRMDEFKQKVERALERGELTKEQAAAKIESYRTEIAARHKHTGIASHLKKLGINEKQIKAIHRSLKDAGLNGDQIEKAMGAMTHMMHALKKGGGDEVHAELRAYLSKKAELNPAQIELVHALARLYAQNRMVPYKLEVKSEVGSTQGK